MMKKLLTGLLAAALLTAGTTGALAVGRGANCADADGDGVCDNYASRPQGGRGANCADADGDGVCDNYASRPQGGGCGKGGGRGR